MEIGSLVQLRGGGPVMTVTATQADSDQIRCSWFNRSGEYEFEFFEAWISSKALIARD